MIRKRLNKVTYYVQGMDVARAARVHYLLVKGKVHRTVLRIILDEPEQLQFHPLLELARYMLVDSRSPWRRHYGQGTIEYALILGLVLAAVLLILLVLSAQISTIYSEILSAIP